MILSVRFEFSRLVHYQELLASVFQLTDLSEIKLTAELPGCNGFVLSVGVPVKIFQDEAAQAVVVIAGVSNKSLSLWRDYFSGKSGSRDEAYRCWVVGEEVRALVLCAPFAMGADLQYQVIEALSFDVEAAGILRREQLTSQRAAYDQNLLESFIKWRPRWSDSARMVLGKPMMWRFSSVSVAEACWLPGVTRWEVGSHAQGRSDLVYDVFLHAGMSELRLSRMHPRFLSEDPEVRSITVLAPAVSPSFSRKKLGELVIKLCSVSVV